MAKLKPFHAPDELDTGEWHKAYRTHEKHEVRICFLHWPNTPPRWRIFIHDTEVFDLCANCLTRMKEFTTCGCPQDS